MNKVKATFYTEKSKFDITDVNDLKYGLYHKSSIKAIQNILNKYKIPLTDEMVIDEYIKTYDIDALMEQYEVKYEKELDEINQMDILFDDECIPLFIIKVLENKFNNCDAPDPYFINSLIYNLEQYSGKQKFISALRIFENINKLKVYRNINELSPLFDRHGIDIEYELSNILCIEMGNLNLSYKDTIRITDEAFKIFELYELDNPASLYRDCLGLLARFGFDKVKDQFKEGLNTYPNNQLMLYNSVLVELMSYCKEKNNYTDFNRLYEEALHLPVKNDEEADYLLLIKENFDLDVKEIKKTDLSRKQCTCKDTNCPYHPVNHDQGCSLCIAKNIKEREIPSCLFNLIDDGSEHEYHFEDFAKMVLKGVSE